MNNRRRPTRPVTGILLLDKPQGLSSNSVLQHARRLYQAEKAGHTGSLDPLATGLLPVCFGQATKLCGYLLDSDKRYVVRARLGEGTDTGDADGQVIAQSDASGIDRDTILQALPKLTGAILQRPPIYSALKHKGERLYAIARRGGTVDRELRPQTIHALVLTAFEPGFMELDVRCSKGTYIRSLVEDLARSIGQQAHVVALRRLESGPFAQPMHSLDDLERIAGQGIEALDGLLRPTLDGLAGWRRLPVSPEQARRLFHGQEVTVDPGIAAGRVAVLGPQNQLLGLGEVVAGGALHPRTWMSGGETG